MTNLPAQDNLNDSFNYTSDTTELSVSEASALLKVSNSSLRRLEAEGRIKSTRLSNGYRAFRLTEVQKLKEELAQEKLAKKSKQVTQPAALPIQPKPVTKVAPVRKPINKKALANAAMFSLIVAIAAAVPFFGYNTYKNLKSNGVALSANDDKSPLAFLQDKIAYVSVKGQVLQSDSERRNIIFNVNVPSAFKDLVTVEDNLTVNGISNLTQIDLSGVASINNLAAINQTTENTLEAALDLSGDVTSTGLNNTQISSIGGIELGDLTDDEGNIMMIADGKWSSLPQTDITQVGVIDTGTWEGDPIEASYLTGVWFLEGNSGTDPSTNFIGTTDAQDVAFRTNDTERVRISQTGNVGIGNASPAALLAVGTSSQFTVNSSGNITKINNIAYSFPASQASASGQLLQNDGSGNLSWATINTDISDDTLDFTEFKDNLTLDASTDIALGGFNFSVSGSGNVNINNSGTISLNGLAYTFPSVHNASGSVLTNNGSGTLTWGSVLANDVADDTLDYTEFRDVMGLDASTSVNFNGFNASFAGTGNFGIGTSSPVNRLDVSGSVAFGSLPSTSLPQSNSAYFSGNVGIGTTNPDYTLDIAGNFRATGTTNLNNLTYTWPASHVSGGVLTNNGSGTLTWGSVVATDVADDTLDFTEFRDLMGLDANTYVNMGGFNFALAGSGNVGIGNSDPQYKFDVTGSASATTLYQNGYQVCDLSGNCAGVAGIGGSGIVGYLSRFTSTTSIGNSVIYDDGTNVGIGTTVPAYKLQVAGTLGIPAASLYINNTQVNATATELNLLVGRSTLLDINTVFETDVTGTYNTLQLAADVVDDNELVNALNYSGTLNLTGSLQIAGTQVTSSATELNYVDGSTVTAGGVIFGNGTNFTQDAANFYYNNTSDNLGIGTTNPQYKLQVAGSIAGTTITDGTASLSSGNLTGLNNLSAGGTITLSGLAGGSTNTVLTLSAGNVVQTRSIDSRVWGASLLDGSGTTNFSARFTDADSITTGSIYDNGTNVGVGTTNANSTFTVGSNNQFTVSSTGNLTRINDVAYSWPSSQGGASTVLSNNGSGTLTWASAASLGTNYWSLTGTTLVPSTSTNNIATLGNAGVGTTTPLNRLDVSGSVAFGSLPTTALPQANSAYFSGNVGVGTTNPLAPLSVTGNVIVTGTTTFNGIAYTWPGSQSSNAVLSTNGSGTLSWASAASLGTNYWSLTGTTLVPSTSSYNIGTLGNIGAGTTTPRNVLDVSGSVAFGSLPTTALPQANSAYFSGNVGIGTTNPRGTFEVVGTTTLNGLTYTWPSSQSPSRVLTTDGSGNLTWGNVVATDVSADTLDFEHFRDTMGLDATTSINLNGFNLGIAGTGFIGIGTSNPNPNARLTLQGAGTGTGFSLLSRDSTGADTFAILDNGNIGVGTTSPNSKFDIAGQLRVRNDDTAVVLTGDSAAISFASVTGLKSIITGGTTSLAIAPAGRLFLGPNSSNIGIGTSNPSTNARLTVDGNGTGTGFTLLTRASDGSNKFVVQDNGNVGIGTTVPAESLDIVGNLKVSGTTNFNGIAYTWPGSQNPNYVLTTNGSGTLTWTSVAGVGGLNGTGATNRIAYFSGPSTLTTNDNFYMDTTNIRLGIGTSNPTNTLDIRGTVAFGTGAGGLLPQANSAYFSGNVGLNTTNPAYRLEVNGTLGVTGSASFTSLSDGVAYINSGVLTTESQLSLSRGGTGLNASTAPNGTLLIGNGSGFSIAALTAGTGIQVTNGAGSISLALTNTGVGATTYGNSAAFPIITVDAQGRITSASTQAFSYESPLTFSNGLTRVSDAVTLGGLLTGITTINQNGNNFSFGGTGNFGIGTSSPINRLDVSGSVAFGSLPTTALPQANSAYFSGNVGIGTTNPRGAFEVVGTTTLNGLTYTWPSTQNTNYVLTTNGSGTLSWTSVAGVGGLNGTGAINRLAYFSDASTLTTNDNFYLDTSNIRLGIGTSNPTNTLDVRGSVAFGAGAGGTLPQANSAYISGNLGLGNTNPQYKLEVNGTLGVTGSASFTSLSNGVAYINSNVLTTESQLSLARGGTGLNASTAPSGTLLIGNGSGFSIAALTAGTGIQITNGAGSISLALTNTGVGATTYGNSTSIPVITVDAQGRITAASNQAISYESPLTFSNGLTRTSNNVALGGLLSGTTTINMNSNNFSFGGTGNFGIGTSSPVNRLDVNGSVAFGSLPTTALPQANSAYFSGNVGIGTTNPRGAFEVVGTTTLNNITYTWPSSQGTNYVLTTNGSGTLTWSSVSGVGGLNGTGSTNRIAYFSDASTLTTNDALYFDSTNFRLGIGTSNPNDKLDVRGSVAFGAGAGGALPQNNSAYFSGNLGLGTTNPQYKLEVTGTLGVTGSATFTSLSNGVAYLNSGVLSTESQLSSARGGTGLDGSTAPNGSLLIGNGTGFSIATLTQGTGIQVTNGAGSISLALTNTGVGATTYGNSTSIPVITVDAQGRITAASNQVISFETPLTFSNGLTRSSNAVTLGGLLSGTTTVNQNGNNFSFGGTGNFGIGTSSPVNRLDVSGSVAFGSLPTTALPRANSAYFSGNVGIGTTNPSASLYVTGNAAIGATGSSLSPTLSLTTPTAGGGAGGTTNIGLDIALGGGGANSSGTINNYNFRAAGGTPASPSGTGIINNYTAHFTTPAGTNGGNGVNNYGVYLSGNGGSNANNFSFYNASTAKSYFAGNVGIGTTNPLAALSVTGNTIITGTTTLNGLTYTWPAAQGTNYVLTTNGSGTLTWNSVSGVGSLTGNGAINRIAYYDSSSSLTTNDALYFDSTNLRLGIGTSNPNNKLDVRGTVAFGADAGGLLPQVNSAYFSGNVGIGTTNPRGAFEVVGTTTLNGLTYTWPSTQNTNYVLTTNGSGTLSWTSVSGVGGLSGTGATNRVAVFNGSSSLTAPDLFYWDVTNNRLGIGTSNPDSNARLTVQGSGTGTSISLLTRAADGTQGLAVLDNGNIGVGTTDPASKFHVQWASVGATNQRFSDAFIFENSSNVFLQLMGGTTSERAINFADSDNGADGAIKFNNSDVPDGFMFSTGGNNFRMALTASGNLGIGTTLPRSELEVVGQTTFNGLTYTWPSTQNTNYVLTTNGSGTLSWTSVAGVGGLNGTGATNRLAYFSDASTLTTNDNFYLDTSNIRLGIGTSNPTNTLDVRGSVAFGAGAGGLLPQANSAYFSGNLGLGTTNPLYKLEVVGTLGVSGSATFTSLTNGVAYLNSGVLSTESQLSSARGGTGLDGSTAPNGSLLIGNGTGFTIAGLTAGTGIQVTNGAGSISLALTNTGVGATTYGNSTSIPVITVDAQGRITSASNQAISYESPLTFSNGLTRTSNAVTLGGLLSGTTTINQNGNNFSLGGTGNFGIGTSSPVNRLDVSGSVAFGSTPTISLPQSNSAYFSGNVGIGTTNPGSKLELKVNTSTSTNLLSLFTESGTTSLSKYSIRIGREFSNRYVEFGARTNNGNPNFEEPTFYIGSPTLEVFNANTVSGRVGIGTTAPNNKFEVSGTVAFGSLPNNSLPQANSAYFSGNVGIGTTNPRSPLEVVGTTTFNGLTYTWPASQSASAILTTNGSGTLSWTAQSALNYWSLTGSTLVPLTSSNNIGTLGNAGIGTTTPKNALDVSGSVAFGSLPTTALPQANSAYFSGNVGIGTSNPNQKLDINGGIIINSGLSNSSTRPAIASTIVNGEIHGYSSGGLTLDDGFLRLSAGGGTTASQKSFIDLTGFSTPDTQLNDMNKNIVLGTNGVERVRIANGGNVGIGNTLPTFKLDVNGTLRVTSTTTFNGITYTWPASQSANSVLQTNGSGTLSWTSSASVGTNYWSLTGTTLVPNTATNNIGTLGNLGVGTTTPRNALEVSGSVAFGSLPGSALPQSNSVYISGGLGIGTTNPAGLLEIASNSTNDLLLTRYSTDISSTGFIGRKARGSISGASAVAGQDNLAFFAGRGFDGSGWSGNAGAVIIKSAQSFTGSAYGTEITLEVTPINSTTRAEAVRIANTGNVGIGTSTPLYKLTVNGDIQIASGSDLYIGSIGLNDTAGVSTSGASLVGTFDEFTYSNGTNVQNVLDDLDNQLSLAAATTYWARTGTTLVPLTSTDNIGTLGNAGIGTTTPRNALDVSGSVAFGSLPTTALPRANSAYFSGNVGIGTTNPSEALSVVGKAQITNSSGIANTLLRLSNTATGGKTYVINTSVGTGLIPDGYLTIRDETAGVNRLTIDTNGNVGIGTTVPAYPLDVTGNFRTTGTTTFNGIAYTWPASQSANAVLQTNGSGTLSWAAASSLNYWSLTGTTLVPNTASNNIATLGNAGIGTTSPLNRFDVSGSVAFGSLPTTALPQANSAYFSGNVGIGTTNPRGAFEVVGQTTLNGLTYTWPSTQNTNYVLTTNGSGTLTWSSVSGVGGLNGTGAINRLAYFSDASTLTTNDNFYLDTSNIRLGIGTSNPTNTLDVRGTVAFGAGAGGLLPQANSAYFSGNVGIGTTNPSAELDVIGQIRSSRSNTGTRGHSILLARDTVTAAAIGTQGTPGSGGAYDVYFELPAGQSNQLLVLSSTGFVGISATNPRNKLDVSGSVAFGSIPTTALPQSNSAYFSGNVGIGTTNPRGAFEVVGQTTLNGLTYTWPSSQSANAVLTTNGSGTLSWSSSASVGTNYWSLTGSTLVPNTSSNNIGTLGNIGAGTTTPRNVLDVNGSVAFGSLPTTALPQANSAYFSGNVGIGTTNAGAKLQVAATNGTEAAIFGATNGTDSNLRFVPDSNDNYNYIQAGISNSDTNARLRISRFSSLSNIAEFRVSADIAAFDGNVGIGTTAPLYPLDVAGNIRTTGTTTFNGIAYTWPGSQSANAVLQTNGSGTLSWASSASVGTNYWSLTGTTLVPLTSSNNIGTLGSVGVGTTTPRNILDVNGSVAFGSLPTTALPQANSAYFSGNVGIGTTNPATKLNVLGLNQNVISMTTTSGNLGATLALDDTGNTVGAGGALLFGATNGSVYRYAAIKGLAQNGGNNGSGDIAFAIRPLATDATLTEAMRIQYTGRVGIGTSVPVNKLDVSGSVAFGSLPTTALPQANSAYFSGNVGIGTTNPTSPFYIKASSAITAVIESNTSSTGLQLNNTGTGGTNWQLYSTANSSSVGGGKFGIQTGNSTWRLLIDTNGNVGIGTTNPTSALTIAGSTFGINSLSYTFPAAHTTNGVLVNNGSGTLSWSTLPGSIFTADSLDFTDFRDVMGLDANTSINLNGFNLGIAGTGNVGIGTSSPLNTLDVSGSVAFGSLPTTSLPQSNSAYFSGNIGIADTNPLSRLVVNGQDNDQIQLQDAGTTFGYIYGSANGEYLQVVSTRNGLNLGATERVLIDDSSTGSGNNDVFGTAINVDSFLANKSLIILGNNNSAGGDFRISGGNIGIADTNPKNRLAVIGSVTFGAAVTDALPQSNSASFSGNVGIGTTNPRAPLEILSGTNSGLRLMSANAGYWDLAATYHTTNADLIFRANGTETLRIDNTGKVGIGNTVPTALLDVNGTFRVSGTTTLGGLTYTWPGSQSANAVLQTNGSGTLSWASAASLGTNYWSLTGTTLVPNTSSNNIGTLGSLGVGTTTPRNALDVSGRVAFGSLPASQIPQNNSAYFSGNVGIGDTNPLAKLIIDGGSQSNPFYVTSSNVVWTSLQINNSSTNGTTFYLKSYGQTGILPGGFGIESSVGTSQKLVIDTNGNVGIGTTNPNSRLTVGTNSQFAINSTGNITRINDVAYSWPSSQGGASTVLTNNGSGTLTWAAAATGYFDLFVNTIVPSTNTNNIATLGNLGVGTTTPKNALDVSGSVAFGSLPSTQLPQSNSAYFSGNVGIGTTNPTSALTIAGSTFGINTLSYTFPSSHTSNSVLVNNGSGTLTWSTLPGSLLTSDSLDFTDFRDVMGLDASTSINLNGFNLGIAGTGLVGIGTSNPNPNATLTVQGSGTSTGFNLLTRASNGTNIFAIVDNGNVGIGTTTPSSVLEVNASTNNALTLTRTGSIANEANIIFNTNGSGAAQIRGINGGGLRFTDSSATTEWARINSNGNIGIGTTNPLFPLDVTGNARITGTTTLNGIAYTWPASQSAGAVLTTNGSGTLSWSAASSLNYWSLTGTTLVPLISTNNIGTLGNLGVGTTTPQNRLDVSGSVAFGSLPSGALPQSNSAYFSGNVGIGTTNPLANLSVLSTATTGTAVSFTGNSLSTGNLLSLSSTSTSLTGGKLFSLDWSPTATTTLTGNLMNINVGSSAFINGSIFAIQDNGTDIFTVSQSQITSALPHNFTGAGDVTIANDLILTNTTAANINFTGGPGYIRTQHPSGNYDLTLSAANLGSVLIADTFVAQNATDNLNAYEFFDADGGTPILSIDAINERVGIGTTGPLSTLAIAGNIALGSGYSRSAGVTDGLIVQGNVGIATSAPSNNLVVVGRASFGAPVAQLPQANSASFSGNVGIGTTNPTYSLSVNGITNITGTNIQPSTNITSLGLGHYTGYSWIQSYSGEPLSINGIGNNVGIGTTNPSSATLTVVNSGAAQLALKSTASTDREFRWQVFTDGISYIGPQLLSGTADASLVIRTGQDSGSNTGDIRFYTGSSYKASLLSGGNFGIGTTNPTEKLEVGGSANFYGTPGHAGIGNGIYLGPTNNSREVQMYRPSTAELAFGRFNGGWFESLRINNNGNVGIGVSSPKNKLDVSGAVAFGSLPTTALPQANSAYFSGNVGIGTTNPLFALTTAGSIGPSADDTYDLGSNTARWKDIYLGPGSIHLGTSTSDEYVMNYDTTANNLEFNFAGTGQAEVAFNSNGFVGIGTTNPVANLHILSSQTTGPAFTLNANSLTTGTGVDLTANLLTSGKALNITSTSTNWTTGSLLNLDWSPTSVPFNSTGDLVSINVGSNALLNNIFTIKDNNSSIFSVSKTGITSALPHSFTAAGDVSIAYDQIFTNQTASYIKSYGPLYIESGESFENNNLTLKTYGTGKVFFDLSGTGNVLLQGTATSSYLLDVQNNDGVTSGEHFIANFGRTSGTANSVVLGYISDGTGVVGGMVRGGDNKPLFLGTSSSNKTLTLTETGNAGIGTTNPTQVLTVNGRISMATWTADGDTAAYRDTATNSIALVTSDVRLKKNIVPLENSLNIAMQLNPYMYNELDETDGTKKRLGIMAQDVMPLLPELTYSFTKEGESTSYYGVHYDKLPVLLLGALKQQQALIEELTINQTGALANAYNKEEIDTKFGNVDTVIGVNAQTEAANIVSGTNPAITDVLGDLDTRLSTVSADLADVKNSISSIQGFIDLLSTNESSESTESSGSTPLAQIVTQMQNIYNDFVAFVEALGLSSTVDQNGQKTLTVENDLNVLGDTTLNNLTVTGDFNAGLMKLDSVENSIGILGPACFNIATGNMDSELCSTQTLFIQKDLAGNIDFLDGSVVIAADGTLTVNGTINAEKVAAEEFAVKSSSSTIGTATLTAGQTEVEIPTTSVKDNSKIFITATSSTQGKQLYVAQKTADTSFTVAVDSAAGTDIVFDWWIVSIDE